MEERLHLILKAQQGDKQTRDELIEENLGLVRHIVKRFLNRGYEAEDLFQIGCIGLIKALDHYDEKFEVRFSTYAVPVIMGEIKRFLRDNGMIKVSRSLKETAWKIRKESEKLQKETGRDATVEELANATKIPVEEIVMALEATDPVESIYKTIYQNDGNEICLADKLVVKKDEQEELIDQLFLKQLMDSLKEEEQKLIRLRYFDEITQTEVAKELGISQVQVSRMEKKILLRMRKQVIMDSPIKEKLC